PPTRAVQSSRMNIAAIKNQVIGKLGKRGVFRTTEIDNVVNILRISGWKKFDADELVMMRLRFGHDCGLLVWRQDPGHCAGMQCRLQPLAILRDAVQVRGANCYVVSISAGASSFERKNDRANVSRTSRQHDRVTKSR